MKINAEKSNVREWLSLSMEGKAGKQHQKLWAKVYSTMNVPSRRRSSVNLAKIDKASREGEHVIVPGKVVGTGSMGHKVTITALEYSKTAEEELGRSGCEIVAIKDAYAAINKGKANVRIVK